MGLTLPWLPLRVPGFLASPVGGGIGVCGVVLVLEERIKVHMGVF